MQSVRSYHDLISRFHASAAEIGTALTAIGSFRCPMGQYDIFKMEFVFGDGRQSICISTGMHGDEPAGPEALLAGLSKLNAKKNRINARFLVFPCDNPTGWELNTRENYAGLDLNREFAKVGQADEIAIVESELARHRIDFTYDLHEDVDVFGMYLYERARRGVKTLAGEMIEALRNRGYPIHEADWIEGLPASGGVIRPPGRLRKKALPKQVFLWHQGVMHLVTSESPGKLDLETRVRMQLVCFDLVIDEIIRDRFVRPPDLMNQA